MTSMLHRLYSVGYLNPGTLDLLQERVNQGAVILDIRLVAASRYRPEFSGKRLHARFGAAYQRLPELGNENYNQPGAPIRLHNPEQGIPQLLTLLEQYDVCLLCRCQQIAGCHTTMVVDSLQHVQPDLQVIRLGEQIAAAAGQTKCLSIRQPWTWIITHPTEVAACGLAPKTVENRNWYSHYRGPLLLHAGATMETSLFDRRTGLLLPGYWKRQFGATGAHLAHIMPQHRNNYPTRAIVGYADLVDVVAESSSPWFIGDYGFVLANARAIISPMSHPGQRMLFNVTAIQMDDLGEEKKR